MNHPMEVEATPAASTATCRRAMALNNVGVAMMEQGSFRHAISNFKDSFAVMSSAHYIPSGEEFEDLFLAVSQEEHQQEPPSSANRYQMAAQQQHLSNNNGPLYNLEICPCDDGDLSFQMSALPYITKFVPICLRSHDFYEQQGGGSHDNNANLALAIIMYNSGMANLLAHLQDKKYTSSMMGCCSPTQHGRKLLHAAVVTLRCSQVMIDRHLDAIDNDETGGRGKAFEKLGGLVVSAMTLKTMMWTSRLDNKYQEAAKVGARFSHILIDMNRYQDQLQKLNVDLCQNPTSTAA